MLNAYKILKNLVENKLENYFVKTNDSKFDDVSQIIGDGYKDGKAYLITNSPVRITIIFNQVLLIVLLECNMVINLMDNKFHLALRE